MTPNQEHCLLIVDDEPNVCDSVHDLLRREFRVLKAHSAEEGYRLMQEEEVHIVMSDQRMPQITGVELLAKVKSKYPQAVRMLFTGFADLESIIAAINQGHIFRFLKKPWQPEELEAAVRQAAAEYDRLTVAERERESSCSSRSTTSSSALERARERGADGWDGLVRRTASDAGPNVDSDAETDPSLESWMRTSGDTPCWSSTTKSTCSRACATCSIARTAS